MALSRAGTEGGGAVTDIDSRELCVKSSGMAAGVSEVTSFVVPARAVSGSCVDCGGSDAWNDSVMEDGETERLRLFSSGRASRCVLWTREANRVSPGLI